jgi:Phosphotransferase enzyme family
MWPDAAIERSIFGSGDPVEIWAQVLGICPEAVSCFAFEVSVGALFGLVLGDGSRVALKVHVGRVRADYLRAAQAVQRHLFEHGFPCPEPLGVRTRATLEEWRDEGVYRDAHEPAVRRAIAEQLHALFRATSELEPTAALEPFFPRTSERLWPVPHNVLCDFEATARGAEWIDEIAQTAKQWSDAHSGPLVIGHHDWVVKHFRFDNRLRPTVIYDWDSLSTDRETSFVGEAASTFTYTEHVPVSLWPNPEEAKAFMEDYVAARGSPFTPEERRAMNAAAVYSRAYATRCVHAFGDASQMQLQEYAEAFL